MKILFFILIIFITACSAQQSKKDFIFDENLSFEEFKIKLNKYVKENPFPNIDE